MESKRLSHLSSNYSNFENFSPDPEVSCNLPQNNYTKFAFDKLNEDRSTNQQFCDFTIKTGTQDFPVHKCMLRVASEFFKQMFETNMKEKFENCVKIETIEPEIMKAVIEFIYNNSSLIDCDNVNEVLKASHYLQIPPLLTYCTEIMEINLTQQNVMDAWILAKKFNLESLITKSSKLICSVFDTILMQKRFLEVDSGNIEEFFNLKNEYTPEESFYQSIMEWVNDKFENRKTLFPKLFCLIDFSRISKAFLREKISVNELVSSNPECSMKLVEAMSKVMLQHEEETKKQAKTITEQTEKMDQQNKTILKKDQLIKKQRVFLKQQAVLIEPLAYIVPPPTVDRLYVSISKSCRLFFRRFEFAAVWNDGYKSKLLKYNVATNHWHEVVGPRFCNTFAGLVYADDKLYAIGGTNNKIDLNSNSKMESFDLITDKGWYEKKGMLQNRYSFGCAVYNSNIYVAGGRAHKEEHFSSVESYSLSRNKWKKQRSLNHKRAGCCMVNYNDQLHVLGGFNSNSVHNSIEILCNGKWIKGTPMNCARANFAAVVLNGELYAIGGEDKDGHLSSVEKFNYNDACWTFVEPLIEERHNHSACVVDGKIFVVGGESPNNIEIYHQEEDQWECLNVNVFIGQNNGEAIAALNVHQ